MARDADGITYLLWHDLVGITRTRGVPSRSLSDRAAHGLGWACAGQALTPFEDIVDNPWGPMDEVRQTPDLETRFTIPGNDTAPPLSAVICDSLADNGTPWSCCGRSFLKAALEDLKTETGLSVVSAVEHEYSLEGPAIVARTPFSLAAAREVQPYLLELEHCLRAVGAEPFSIEPEYGLGQYEVAGSPVLGLAGADVSLITRETIRAVAQRHGLAASFTPKPTPDAVGNGAHLHISLADETGRNVAYEAGAPLSLSPLARHFAAGILAHLNALVAFTAPAPISYHRLGPHHWSCGFRAIGLQNREAAIRVIPGRGDKAGRRKGHNLEFRPIDGIASPYLALGVLVRAGLEGIRGKLELMEPLTGDPADLTEAERTARGIAILPTSLEAALAALEADTTVCGWFGQDFLATYLALKRWEVDFAAKTPTAELFARYRSAY